MSCFHLRILKLVPWNVSEKRTSCAFAFREWSFHPYNPRDLPAEIEHSVIWRFSSRSSSSVLTSRGGDRFGFECSLERNAESFVLVHELENLITALAPISRFRLSASSWKKMAEANDFEANCFEPLLSANQMRKNGGLAGTLATHRVRTKFEIHLSVCCPFVSRNMRQALKNILAATKKMNKARDLKMCENPKKRQNLWKYEPTSSDIMPQDIEYKMYICLHVFLVAELKTDMLAT